MDQHISNSAAEAFAALSGDGNLKGRIQEEVDRCRLVDALVQMRLQKGVSQKQLAERMNCNPSKISRLEAGTDDTLKIGDVRDYVLGLNVGMSMIFEDQELPVAEQIKQHVFSIHEKLERLVKIAAMVDGDKEIIDKINQFYKEVLFNFITKFQASHSMLRMVLAPEATHKETVASSKSLEDCDAELKCVEDRK